MDSSLSTLLEFNVFPRNSVNVVVGPTHIGKTHFVNKLVNNFKVYFTGPVGRILIILCNERVQPLTFDAEIDIPIEQIPLSDFAPYSLEAHDLVVIDDLQSVTAPIKETFNVGAHHYNLASLFIITHDVVGSSNFELLRKCHRIFFFMNASSNIRQVLYIIRHFYHDPEIKNYLFSVAGFCESEKEVLAIELSPVINSSKHFQAVLAFSHITSLLDKGYFFLYPYPSWGKKYTDTFSTFASVTNMESFPEMPANTPQPILVAVPVSNVLAATAADNNQDKTQVKCSEQKQWEDTIQEIEENIESYFPPPRWQTIKNLAKEILRNKEFCVKTDGKTFHLKDRPRTEVSMIDFLAIATRRAGPMEQPGNWKVYAMHVDTLLRNNAPKDLFKNKLLIPKRYQ